LVRTLIPCRAAVPAAGWNCKHIRSRPIAASDKTAPRSSIHTAAGIISVFDAVASLLLFGAYYWLGGDPATAGFDAAAAVAATILFALTGAPALLLVARRRAPRTAVALALAFPVVLVVLLLAVAYKLA
jgi:hypothetical protein